MSEPDAPWPFTFDAAGFAIRRAEAADASAIADMIRGVVATSNAPDYPVDALLQVIAGYRKERIAAALRLGPILIAEGAEGLIGTAALARDRIEAVFVLPAWQGTGVGTALVSQVVEAARGRGVRVLRVLASLTATGFYRRLGFVTLGAPVGERIPMVPMAIRLD
ncbi:MAG: GNAT family N-acetyltransferase [Azospirillaceae bacterium]